MSLSLQYLPHRASAREMFFHRAAAVFLWAALAVTPCGAAEVSGKALEKITQCATCDGRDGIGTGPTFPNLAGQKSQYLTKALREYRSSKRSDPVMSVAARELTDEEITALAEYYESLGASK